MSKEKERLQKVIAHSGLTSRRKAEQLIVDGKVKVNGQLVTELGTKVSKADEVTVNGIPLEKEQHVYYVLYKPREYITAVSDDKGRKTVMDLLEEIPERIYPVGRLDYQSSGILLMTNDGSFAHRLMHPSFEVAKQYVVKIEGIIPKEKQNQLLEGVRDGDDILKVSQYNVKQVDRRKRTMIIELTLHEGKNRHIRRLFARLGYPVEKLKREKYGFLSLGNLQPGEYRALTRKEVHDLVQLVNKK